MQLRDSAIQVPAARTVDLVTTESKDEALVYDLTAHHIHHLNATATKVWRLCDGERMVGEIAAESGLAEDAVKLALRTLEDAKLLDGPLKTTMRGAQSRRAFMKKAAIAGVSVPAIVSITASSAAANQSCNGSNAVACTVANDGACCKIARGGFGTCTSGTCG